MLQIITSVMSSLWGVLGLVFAGLLIYGLVTGTDPRDVGTSHRAPEALQLR